MHQQLSQISPGASFPDAEIADRVLAVARGLLDMVHRAADEASRFVTAFAITSSAIRLPEPGLGAAPRSIQDGPRHPCI